MDGIIDFFGAENTKIAVTVISTVVGIFLTITKIKSMLPRPRLYLKEDIEILDKLAKDKKEEYEIVSAYVKNRIREIYSNQERDNASYASNKIFTTAVGALMSLLGLYLTYAVHNSEDWSSFWYIGTIYLIVLGVGVISIPDFLKRSHQTLREKTQEDAESLDRSEQTKDEKLTT